MKFRIGFVVLLLLTLLIITACERELETTEPPAPVVRDLSEILEDGTLKALVTFNSTGYFIYRGEPLGYEYELLKAFADEHDVELKLTVVRDRSELWTKLNAGEGDVAAARILRTTADEKHVTFTRPLHQSQPVLVQREGPPEDLPIPNAIEEKLEIPERLEPAQVSARLIRSPEELAGTTVHVVHESPHRERLVELENQLTGEIEIVEVEQVASVEPLIRRIARGEIRLTVSPRNVAELTHEYFTNITVEPAIGPPEQVVWAVRQNAPILLEKLNTWIEAEQQDGVFEELYARYFEQREDYRERIDDDYLTSETGRLSEYDDLIKRHAPDLGWDWRLLASQMYQESKFDPDAKSWAGAMGLLQLMPGTAREVGVSRPYDPEQNVQGAVRYLQKLEEMWSDEIADPSERLKFVFASYNAGRGHVLDAQRLAEKNGDDPQSWDEVSYWLLQLSKREFYNDPVVKYGFCRGLEPVTYVRLILNRFDHYQQFVTQGAGS